MNGRKILVLMALLVWCVGCGGDEECVDGLCNTPPECVEGEACDDGDPEKISADRGARNGHRVRLTVAAQVKAGQRVDARAGKEQQCRQGKCVHQKSSLVHQFPLS